MVNSRRSKYRETTQEKWKRKHNEHLWAETRTKCAMFTFIISMLTFVFLILFNTIWR